MPHCKDWGLLFPKGMNSKSKVIAYVSQSLHPNKKNYSLAKLELLVLKWDMMEKLQDYLLESKLTVYMDNNPVTYVVESKLGVIQIRWLIELVLFDFDIKYRTGKFNKAADALSHHPYVPEEMDNNAKSEQYETILCVMDCRELETIIDGEKLPRECMVAIKNKENKTAQQELGLHSHVIEVLSKVSPSEMIEAQQADLIIGQVVQ